MPKYIYTAKNVNGETKGGVMVAKDEKTLAQQLKSDGFLITSVRLSEEKKTGVEIKFFNRFKSVSLKEKMMFSKNLAVMVSSGVPISKAVKNLSFQVKSQQFKKILNSVYDDLQQGLSLSDGLAKFPNAFNDLFVNMIRVGETGGNLEESLNIIGEQLQKEHELLSRVRGALIYPAVIIFAMIGIGILMLTYVLPKILDVFKDMDVVLPLPTRIIIWISNAFQDHFLIMIVVFLIVAVISRMYLKTETGKKNWSLFLVKMPIIGNITIKVNCARFARIHSSLLRSGVGAIESLGIVSKTLGNYYYQRALKRSIKDIQKGIEFSKIIAREEKIFPVIVSQMLEVGEQTGETEKMLVSLAEFYENEVAQITKNLSSIIEPIIMIVIGTAVGFFAIAMLQPMYSLMENIN